jgi:uncharacterized protein
MTAQLSPVDRSKRVESVDVLRGVAVLGILTMNIVAFGLHGESYLNPMSEGAAASSGPFEGANKFVWWATHLLADQKFWSLFSMLFGAGLVLQDLRARADGAQGQKTGFAEIYYRRLLWLFVIGMLHAYLLWYGDILVAYALCGLLLYPMRKMRWGWLVGIGVAVVLMGVLLQAGLGAALSSLGSEGREAQAIIDSGGTLTDNQREAHSRWMESQASFNKSPEDVQKEIQSVRSGFIGTLKYNALSAVILQTLMFAIFAFWKTTGCMLIGMGLAKAGVFSNLRSGAFYVWLALAGYGLGLPLAYVGGARQIEHKFNMIDAWATDWHFNYVGSVLVALGHAAAVMLCLRAGSAKRGPSATPELGLISSRLAALGRMPLTNYLAQSVICTFVFFGWGLGQFGQWTRVEVYALVPVVWAAMLIWSPWWLARYRFGPIEWVWRSLTYLEAATHEHAYKLRIAGRGA